MSKELTLAEAQNPATTPGRLRVLASHKDPAVRRSVAANPNTPDEVLFRLAVHFPQEFLNNEVLDLITFINPNFLAEMPAFARNALLGHAQTPQGFLRWAVKNGDTDTLLSVLRNPNTPSELLDELTNFNLPTVREAAQMHLSLEASSLPNALWWAELESDPLELRQMVLCGMLPDWLAPRLVREPDPMMRQSLAQSFSSPAEVLEALLFDEDEEVRRLARSNPSTLGKSLRLLEWLEAKEVEGGGSRVESQEWREAKETEDQEPTESESLQPSTVNPQPELELPPLEILAKGHVWLRQMVARHPAASLALLEQLSGDDDWHVRSAVASNPNLPLVCLEQLASDHDRDVRMAVVNSPVISGGLLERLVGDPDEEVRKAAMEHPKAPRGVLELFERMEAQDSGLSPEQLTLLARRSEWARRLAASHPNTPLETLEHCRHESDWHTRLAVAKNPKAPPKVLIGLAADSDSEVRQAVARHPNTPTENLLALSSDEQPDVRVQLVNNPALPFEVLLKLGHDDHWKVREAVAAHPLTPPDLLVNLAQDPDRDVRQAVAGNPNVPEAALETLFSGWFAALEAPIGLTELYHRISAFGEVPSELLAQFAQGNEWAKRLAARHPATPDHALWQLASDEDWRVRQAVAMNPQISQELLLRLCQDADVDVRRAVCTHAKVPDEALVHLALDEQQDLRLKVAENPRASVFALTRLLCDEDESVRQAARQNPITLPDQIELHTRAEAFDGGLEVSFLDQLFASSTWGRTLVAQNPAAPADLLAQLVADTDWRVRQALAKNPASSPEALATLAPDADRDVRQAVAEHPNTSQETLLVLLNDSDENVRLAVLRNAALKPQVLQEYRLRLMVRASRSRYSLNRALALSQPELPLLELSKLRHRSAPAWIVRYALTQNPATPNEVLEELGLDGNRLVREEAEKSREKRKVKT